MDRIINWLLLTIIFVFDPLAIALVIAANFAFEQMKSNTFIPKSIRVRQPKKVKMSIPEGMEFNKSYSTPEKTKLEKQDLIINEPEENITNIPKEDKKSSDFKIVENENNDIYYDELDLNRDGIVDEEELKYHKAVEELKNKKLEGGWDSTWFKDNLKKIPRPPKKNDN